MNVKKLLKFYFGAEGLNAAMDRAILNVAVRSADVVMGGERSAERIGRIISAKAELSSLWQSLDGVISRMPACDVDALRGYAALRRGVRSLDEGARKVIHRSVMKFSRRSAPLHGRFCAAERILDAYYALVSVNIG